MDDDKINSIFQDLTNNVGNNIRLVIVNSENQQKYRFYNTFSDMIDIHYRFSSIYKIYQDDDEGNTILFIAIRYYDRILENMLDDNEESVNSQDASEEYTRELSEIIYSKQGNVIYLKEQENDNDIFF